MLSVHLCITSVHLRNCLTTPTPCYFKIVMAALVQYGSSGEEEEEDVKEETETLTATSLNYNDSSKVLSSLKERISINSTPSVPNKVSDIMGIK